MNDEAQAIDVAISLRDSKLISQDEFYQVLECIKQCLGRRDDGKCPHTEEWES